MRDTPVPKAVLDRATRFKIYDPDTGYDGTASLEDFGLVTATTGPGGGIRLSDPAIEDAVRSTAADVRGRGTVIWQYTGIYGPEPITGSKAPQSYADAGDGILVEPKVGDYTEVSFPMLGSAVSVPKSYVLERSEEHTSELQSRENLVCRLLLEKKK